ncbi:MAG: hypothetical protein IPK07_32445 [Deltaproteobacteria bacterium]|jgi:hypothetical protein|nr:hypothetical protein [Deltaproteobacteria bacterium]
MKTEDEKRFDIRMLDRNLKDRQISRADIDKQLSGLQDLTEDADWVNYDQITSARVGKLAARGESADGDSGASSAMDLDD